jgi:hypothetical protein
MQTREYTQTDIKNNLQISAVFTVVIQPLLPEKKERYIPKQDKDRIEDPSCGWVREH